MNRCIPALRRLLRFGVLACTGTSLIALGACESAVAPAPDVALPDAPALAQQSGAPVRPMPPAMLVKTPRYPAIALYIVYREYLHRNPGLTTLSPDDREYQRYMEQRMRELYPQQGYAGMMREAVEEARQNRLAWQQYEREMEEYERQIALSSGAQAFTSFTMTTTCGGTADPYAGADPSWTGQEEFAVPPDELLPTIQMEIDSLQLVGTEVDEIYYFESLATGTYTGGGGGGGGGGVGGGEQMTGVEGDPAIDDLIRAAAGGRTPYRDQVTIQINPAWVAAGITSLAVIGWKAYRIDQSIDRARRKSAEFYPGLAYDDTKRDAHRHILWSMMLRRWVGRALAKELTDYHERNSSGPAHVMDLHNNDIGRSHRYNSFRGHWFWDRWDWGEWAAKVRNYINDPANAEYIAEWQAGPTTEQAFAREQCVPDEKYIYFAP